MVDTSTETTETTEIAVVLPKSTVRRLDEVATEDHRSRDELLADITRRFLFERQLSEIQRELAPKFAAAGLLTEDDIEDFMDSLDEE